MAWHPPDAGTAPGDARFVALLERIGLAPVPAARTWMEDR